MTTDKTPATLATVKHGGCVQLGDGLADEIDLIRAVLDGYPDSIARTDALRSVRVIRSAIAARPPVGELNLPPDGYYKIVYDDAQVPDESFARTGALDAALRRFEQISERWNAHLFVRFANNTRDCTVPNATPAQAVDLGQVRAALQAAEALCVCCASVDGYSRSELNAFGQNMRSQFTDALALIDSQAVGNG